MLSSSSANFISFISRSKNLESVLRDCDYESGDDKTDRGGSNVAVLYGAYHINDLSKRFGEIGLKLSTVPLPVVSGGANIPELPANNTMVAWTIPRPVGVDRLAVGGDFMHTFRRYSPVMTVSSLYLVVSTLDWLVLLRLVINSAEAFFSLFSSVGQYNAPIVEISNDQVLDFSLGVVYLSLYFKRHTDLLGSLTTGVVDWNKGLYDEG